VVERGARVGGGERERERERERETIQNLHQTSNSQFQLSSHILLVAIYDVCILNCTKVYKFKTSKSLESKFALLCK
jgi:hypothetical protein